MRKNKGIYVGLICFFLFAAALPFIIDRLIIGNSVPSNISNSDWVSFLGGYTGSIIGAAVTLIGISITIRYTNQQNKLDRELQIRPYCTIEFERGIIIKGTKKYLGTLPLVWNPEKYLRERDSNKRDTYIMYVKNIGLGSALDFSIDVDKVIDVRKPDFTTPEYVYEGMRSKIKILERGEEGVFGIICCFDFDPITEDDLIQRESFGAMHNEPKEYVSQRYKNFDINITLQFFDMFQNKYQQEVVIFGNMSVTSKAGVWQHTCDLSLKKTTSPLKIE